MNRDCIITYFLLTIVNKDESIDVNFLRYKFISLMSPVNIPDVLRKVTMAAELQ